MGIFSSIKDAIFGKKKVAPAAAAPTAPTAAPVAAPAAAPAPVAATADQAISEVDVFAHLEELDAADGRDLNWRSSIVDLMKLVGLESSLAERKELATELGYTGALDGSAEMNIWLHKRVLQELAEHGGKVPAELLD